MKSNQTGNHACRRSLQYAAAITFHGKASVQREGKKEFAITPRTSTHCGSGLSIHVPSDGNEFSRAELYALVKYTAPSKAVYHVAVTQLLKKVPQKQCVVRCGTREADDDVDDDQASYRDGDRVTTVSGSILSDEPSTMQVRKCGSHQLLEIQSDLLVRITGRKAGVHLKMKYCGDYMEYGHSARKDCSSDGYNILDEYEAVDPSSGIRAQVCLVPDFGGSDSLRRRRLFWNTRLYSH